MIRSQIFPLAGLALIAACAGETVVRPRSEGGVANDALQHGREASGSDLVLLLPDTGAPKPDTKASAVDLKPTPLPDTKPAADVWSGPNDIGKPCTSNSDCQFKLCAQNTHTGVNFCTKVCDRCDAVPCPTGSGCQNAGLAYICAPGYPNAPCP
jgi:hypothetical protein